MKSALFISALAAVALAMDPLTFDVLRGSSFHSANKGEFQLSKASSSDGSVTVDTTDLGVYYSVNITLDDQPIQVLIDTGSSDLWVVSADAKYCNYDDDSSSSSSSSAKFHKRNSYNYKCTSETAITSNSEYTEYGLYDPADFNDTGKYFGITYGDYSFASGTWGFAELGVGGATLPQFEIGLANVTNSTPTVFGIGFEDNEASDTSREPGGAFTYTNFPMALKQAGYIDKAMYSLSMNTEKSEGTVLFGDTDSSKYSGDLVTIPMDNIYAEYGYTEPITFNVKAQGITYSHSGTESSDILGGSTSFLLDSGTSSLIVPQETFDYIIKTLKGEYSSDVGLYVTDCSNADSKDTINYKFDGITISAPLSDLLVQFSGESQNECAILAEPSDDPTFMILGDPFLRAAYVVYDLEKYEISLAPVKN